MGEFAEPVLDWLSLMLTSVRAHTPGFMIIGFVLVLLSIASVCAFWSDGRALKYRQEVPPAPINVMLRFTLLVTLASLDGQPAALWTAPAIVIGSYGIGAMTTAPRHWRIGAFLAATQIMVVSIFVALLCPALIIWGRLASALRRQPQD